MGQRLSGVHAPSRSCILQLSLRVRNMTDPLAVQISDTAQCCHCRARARRSGELALRRWVSPPDRKEGNEDSGRVNGIYQRCS